MKIKQLKATNFKNLNKVDVKFGDINIITGKNASGKTNLLNLLTGSLSSSHDIIGDFGINNIVTFSPGIGTTTLSVTISDLSIRYGFFGGSTSELLQPKELTLNKTIDKRMSLKDMSVDFLGFRKLSNQANFSFDYERPDDMVLEKIKSAYKISPKNGNPIENSFDDFEIKSNKFEEEEGSNFLRLRQSASEDLISLNDNSTFADSCRKIYEFVTSASGNVVNLAGSNKYNKKEAALQALDILQENYTKKGSSGFNNILFVFMIAEIQKNQTKHIIFNNDLNFFTNGVVKSLEINQDGAKGVLSKGDIYIESSYGPKNIELISSGTAIIIFFVTLKHWLDIGSKYYKIPSIIVCDELDSAIHPNLIGKFAELLYAISSKTQLFITTHSATFIDQFEKSDLYYMVDLGSLGMKAKIKSNILSYATLIELVKDQEFRSDLINMSNSHLLIDGYIDSVFPKT